MTPEERKVYLKEYREKNKEKIKEYRENNKDQMKEYNKNNLEKIKEYKKEYYETNKEKIKEYIKTEQGRKTSRISDWKRKGVINNDFNSLYNYYINCKNCENCSIELIEGMYGSNKRCLDHDHKTGLFRNVLCNSCNIKRG
tara:strand:+ start:29 stop:451 length:423 start_codon:yes stop_codon:yes gene_type:complete